MRLEAVTTCVGYADFLAYALPANKGQFDYWVIVTTPEDTATQRLCEFHHVQVITTDVFGPKGNFCKGAAINVGLQALSLTGWVMHLDADIVLPPLTRELLEHAHLDENVLYGVDRHTMMGAKCWQRHLEAPRLQQEDASYIHTEAYPVATRFTSAHTGGWVPIGFFQLWHPRTSSVDRYPHQHSSAGRTDMLHAARWPRGRRALLPDLVAYHLESEPTAQGANWAGRTTQPFYVPWWGKRPWRRWWFWWQGWFKPPRPYWP